MPIKITAKFPDPDSADRARARLIGCGADGAAIRTGRSRRSRRTGDVGVIINPFGSTPGRANSTDETWGSLAGANMQHYGGFLWSFEDAPLRSYGSGIGPAWRNPGETVLEVTAPDSLAGEAEGLLFNCHAYDLTREQFS